MTSTTVIKSKEFSQQNIVFTIIKDGDKFVVHKNETVLLKTRSLEAAQESFNSAVTTFEDLI